jgi:hypothetical protein
MSTKSRHSRTLGDSDALVPFSCVGVEDLLSTLSFHEKSPPQRYIGRQTTLMDPISVTFSTRKVYDRYFVTVSVENLHGEPCVVSGLDVHLGPSDLNGTIVDYHKLLKVEIPQTVRIYYG